MDRISIVVPAYNEAGGLTAFIDALRQALSEVPRIEWRLLLVDDGSRDTTWREISVAAERDARVRGVRFVRNFGKEAAIEAGLRESADADAWVVMDADLQHPPELVPELIARWRATAVDVVSATKQGRQEEGSGFRIAVRVFYRIFHGLTRLDLRRASDFKLLSRRVVASYLALPERGKFFRGLTPWLGYREEQVSFVVAERFDGTASRWTLRGLLRYGWAALLSFSGMPLHLIRYLAACMGLLAIALGVQTLWSKVAGQSIEGFTTVILLMLIIGSALLFSLAIIGDYLERIYTELKGRPTYIIDVHTLSHRDLP